MDVDKLKAANLNRESLSATLRTAKGMEALPSTYHLASIDVRTQSDRTSLHHIKHTVRFMDQVQ